MRQTGLYYYHARYYDPRMSMFYGVDPHAENYMSFSPYAYVGNNPLIRIDPDGRDWFRHDETGSVLWQDSNENSVQINEDTFRNIGTEYSTYNDGFRYDYDQNDVVAINEVSGNLNLDGGQYIPRQFTTDNGQIVPVDFSFTTRDGNNAYNAINRNAVSQLITGVNEAINNGANIEAIGISATTNGAHSQNSNHYLRNGARAIDVATINNLPVGNQTIRNSVTIFQNSLNNGPLIRENFGPTLMTRNGQAVSVGGHTNHIHFSVNR